MSDNQYRNILCKNVLENLKTEILTNEGSCYESGRNSSMVTT